MYLIAMCPSNNQQILYTKERMDDLHEIDTPIMIGDVVRAAENSLEYISIL